ncbi:hypothetical protein DMJ13_27355 [halophilic archaeon]|nr:hypothetical protein DMJ13_27355 [halophilic archaeon]
MQIPPLSVPARDETAKETVQRHLAVVYGFGKLILVGIPVQVIVLAAAYLVGKHVLHLTQHTTGWVVILSWFLAAYILKLYARRLFPVNA